MLEFAVLIVLLIIVVRGFASVSILRHLNARMHRIDPKKVLFTFHVGEPRVTLTRKNG